MYRYPFATVMYFLVDFGYVFSGLNTSDDVLVFGIFYE